MTKEKEEILSNQAFHQWKQNDCTVALLKLIDDAIKIGEQSIIEYVKGSNDINVNRINFFKGNLSTLYEIQQSIQNKDAVASFMEVENAKVE